MNIQTKRWARPLALFIAMTMVVMYSFGGVAFADNDNSPKAGVESESRGGHDNGNGKSNGNAFGHDNDEGLPEGEDGTEQEGDEENKLDAGLINPMIQMIVPMVIPLEEALVRVHFHGDAPEGILVTTVLTDTTNGSVTYLATTLLTNGKNYDGKFFVPNAKDFKGRISEDNTTLTNIKTGATIDIKNISAKGKNGWINIITGDENSVYLDVSVLKIADKAKIEIDEFVKFSVTVTNNSEVTVSGIKVVDTWPSEYLEFVTATGVYNQGTHEWTISELGPDEEVTLEITGKGIAKGTATNKVEVSFEGEDSDTTDNVSQVDVLITQTPLELTTDAGIEKTVSQNNVTVGTGVTFTIVVTNHGDVTMTALEIQDAWPGGLEMGEVTAHEGTEFTTVGGIVIWNAGDFEPGESKTLTIAAMTIVAGSITNTAIINYGEGQGDEDPDNDTSSVNVTVTNPVTPPPGGGGGGGGTTTTITPTPTPLAEIPETETPLVEAPEVTLEEQPIPLADVPQTGDNTNIWLLLALMMGSGAGIVLLGRRKETVEK